MNLALPPVRRSAGAYVPARQVGSWLFLSGRGGVQEDGTIASGKVGTDVSTVEAYLHARSAGLQLLAAAHAELGDLRRIKAVAKLFGMVNAVPGYSQHPEVIDGCSGLFLAVLGDTGRHSRSSIGVASLPHNMTVEVEAILVVDV